MDQVKQFLAFAKKQHFWIGCGLAVLVAFLMFFIGASKLSKVFADQKSKAKSAEGQITPLIAGADHPNDHWVSAIKQQTDLQRKDVLDAWSKLYQQEAKFFQWPKDKELGDDFRTVFSRPPGTPNPQLSDLCERYQKFITITMLPRMAKIVDAEWTAGSQSEASPVRGGHHLAGPGIHAPAESDDSHKVIWDDADQKQQYINYDWKSTPSELDVRYAQEEMWVMEAIFQSLARSNEQAQHSYESIVRQIDQVQIGYDAVGKHPLGEGENRVVYHRPRVDLAAGPVSGIPAGGPLGSGGSMAQLLEAKRPPRQQLYSEGGGGAPAPGIRGPVSYPGGPNNIPGGSQGPGLATAAGTDLESILKDGRYVDATGKPIGAAELATRQAAEYKLMAFKIRLQVDPTRFDRVIAEFGKSQVPLELREVRINAESSDSIGGRPDVGPMKHRRPPGAGGEGMPSSGSDMTLELRGVAYIINPPDVAKLGMPAATDAAPPAPGAAPAATTPVATTPAAATPAAATPATGASPAAAPPTIDSTAPATPPAGRTGPATGAAGATTPATPPVTGTADPTAPAAKGTAVGGGSASPATTETTAAPASK